MSASARPRPSIRLFVTVILGLAAGAIAGAGVGTELYPPAVGVALAIAVGAITGAGVWRAARVASGRTREG